MRILDDLLNSVRGEGTVRKLMVGRLITASVVRVEGFDFCGVATTLAGQPDDQQRPAVREAGFLEGRPSWDVACLVKSVRPTEASIGMATLNGLLAFRNQTDPKWMGEPETGVNASDLLNREGQQKKIALVGHFPFVEQLRKEVPGLRVLEKEPRDGDLPADKAPEVIPDADLVALTSSTFVNKTFEGLMKLTRPDASIVVIGPGTPLSPILFDHGVTTLAGAIVDPIEPLLTGVRQGASFRQVRRMGLRFLLVHRS